MEATDGSIGKVDEATSEGGSSYIVVDTGPWIFGKKVQLQRTGLPQPSWGLQRSLLHQVVIIPPLKDLARPGRHAGRARGTVSENRVRLSK